MAVGVVGIDKMPMRKGVGVEREKNIEEGCMERHS